MNITYFLKHIVFLSLAFFLSACVMPSETITLQTQVNIPKNQIGERKTVFISVMDDRPSQYLGSRLGARGAGGKISLSENSITDITSHVEKGLLQNGFRPVFTYNSTIQRKMIVRLLGLQYTWRIEKGIITSPGIVTVTSILSVTAENEEKEFQKIYRSVNTYKVMLFTPAPTQDTAYINETFSDSLNKLINDKDLLQFLVK